MLSRVKIKSKHPSLPSPEEIFVFMDTHGIPKDRTYLCSDNDILDKILKGKENVNLQIQMWVETTLEMPIVLMPDEVKTITKDYPPWVFKSYINRLSKEFLKKRGYIPQFVSSHF